MTAAAMATMTRTARSTPGSFQIALTAYPRAVNKFRAAVEANDMEAMVACLAEDVVFQSPVVFSPYRGRAVVGHLLRTVAGVFKDFHYTDELASSGQTALCFSARVGDKQLEGIDLITLNEHGLVAKLVVFVRPMSGAMALAQAMQAALG